MPLSIVFAATKSILTSCLLNVSRSKIRNVSSSCLLNWLNQSVTDHNDSTSIVNNNLSKTYATIPILRPNPYSYREEYSQGFAKSSYNITKPKMSDKILVAFDFDKTLIDVNSDTYILKLLPDGGANTKIFSNLQWIEYMQKVFDALHVAEISAQTIFSCLESINLTTGMRELVTELKEKGHESIIISDCNNVFINSVLENNGLEECFEQVFTNPAYFDTDDHLHISMYHKQNWCDLSAVNLCKGQVLEEYVKMKNSKGIQYKFISYIGDGYNDFCPMVKLSQNDYAFPRNGYACHKAIQKEDREPFKVKAKVVPWDTGFQIKEVLLH